MTKPHASDAFKDRLAAVVACAHHRGTGDDVQHNFTRADDYQKRCDMTEEARDALIRQRQADIDAAVAEALAEQLLRLRGKDEA